MAEPTTVDFTPPDEKSMSALAGLMMRNVDDLVTITRITAEVRHAYYEALVAKGFAPDQALYLCAQGGTALDYLFRPK